MPFKVKDMILVDFKPEKKPNFNLIGRIKVQVLILLSVLATVLVVAQLIFAAGLATDGAKLAAIEEELSRLEAQNAALRVEIAKVSSLATLSGKARELGFEKPQQVITP